jgi:hypothetical protein
MMEQSILPSLPMSACSKYESCNCPVCPLDKNWKLRTHLRGEPSCHYLRLVVKDNATVDEKLIPAYQAAVRLWEQKDQLPVALMKQLSKAAQSDRKAIPTPLTIDPEKADAAMLRLQALFGESVDKPINLFG